MSLTFRGMTAEQEAVYLPAVVEEYAAELVRSGSYYESRAIAKSQKSYASLHEDDEVYVAAFDGDTWVGVLGFVLKGFDDDPTTERVEREEAFLFTEQLGMLLGLAVWFVFGAGVLANIRGIVTWQMVLYAVLSLTVIRMVPVAVAALGLRLPWDTVALAGWLGPRGLASIVFAILALDAVEGSDGVLVLATVSVTVALSVLAHGLSAGPLATWYSRRHPAQATVETS